MGTLHMEKEWERRLRLAKATKFAEAGRAAGHEIQARVRWGGSQQQQQRGNRRSGSGVKRREQAAPTTAKEFIASGGMERLERRAAFHAAKEAIQLEREFWLGRLQGWLRTVDRDYARGADYVRLTLEGEVKRLRRSLGIKQRDEERRAKTRERVRRHRAEIRNSGS
jgi:hypothetical protein